MEEDIEPLPAEHRESELGRLDGRIQIEGLHFTYTSRPDVKILKGIDLAIKPGQQVAVVGPSGSGKSTLASLILQFYPPESGSISFDGILAKDYNLFDLRTQMAYVPQDIILFGGSIRENISYGNT